MTGVWPSRERVDCASRPHRTATLRQGGDGGGGDGLPALAAVRSSLAGGDGQHSVQQQDALLEPGAQVAVRGGRDAEVGVEFLVDVLQAAGDGAHIGGDGERQTDRVPRGRVRVLTDDQHPHVGQRSAEGAQHVVAGGQVAASLREFLAEKISHGVDLVLDVGQGLGPVGGDEFFKRACHGVTLASLTLRNRPSRTVTKFPDAG